MGASECIDPAFGLSLVQRSVAERRGVESRLDLRCERVALRRQTGDLVLDRRVRAVVARAAALDRAGPRLQQTHAEGAKGRVELLVDLAEPPQRLDVRAVTAALPTRRAGRSGRGRRARRCRSGRSGSGIRRPDISVIGPRCVIAVVADPWDRPCRPTSLRFPGCRPPWFHANVFVGGVVGMVMMRRCRADRRRLGGEEEPVRLREHGQVGVRCGSAVTIWSSFIPTVSATATLSCSGWPV